MWLQKTGRNGNGPLTKVNFFWWSVQGGFSNDNAHGKKLLIMVYMLVIVLADSSEANELVPQITSKNPLESWRERQEDFFFLLLCIHLAVQEHIQWCYWVTGGRNIVQEGAWTLRAGRFQHWGWGSESKQYGPLARKCTAQVGQVFPSVCTALSMRCHGDCQCWIRGPWWKNWWKWRPESCCVEELPQKKLNCITAFGNDCSFHSAPGFPLLFQRLFPEVGNILYEQVGAVIFLTCVNSTDAGHASRLSLQSFTVFMCDETQKLFSLANPQTSAGVPWTQSSDFTGEEQPVMLLCQHGGSQKMCEDRSPVHAHTPRGDLFPSFPPHFVLGCTGVCVCVSL